MTVWVEQWVGITFCIKLTHSSAETIQVIQKATAMGKGWLSASSQQCACSCITSYTEFSSKTSNHSGDSAPYSPDLVPCDFWIYPKLKSPLKGKRFQSINEIQENRIGQLMAVGRTVWSQRGLLWRGLIIILCSVSYILSSSTNVSIFDSTWLDTFWTDLVYFI